MERSIDQARAQTNVSNALPHHHLIFCRNKISVGRASGEPPGKRLSMLSGHFALAARISFYFTLKGVKGWPRHDGVSRSTRVYSAAHPFHPLSTLATYIIRVRAPLDIETDIPFCSSILPGGGGGAARVREPVSPRPPLFLRHLYLHRHLHRHLLGRPCSLRVRRGAVCSSFPSVCRPPSVENHVFPVACYVASRGVAVARLSVSLADNRLITRERDTRRQLRKSHVRDVPQSLLRDVTDDTRGTSSNLTCDSHMSDSVVRT